MSAPDLSRMGGQPQHDCPNCGRSTAWFNPGCRHCGYDFWTGRIGGGGYPEIHAAGGITAWREKNAKAT